MPTPTRTVALLIAAALIGTAATAQAQTAPPSTPSLAASAAVAATAAAPLAPSPSSRRYQRAPLVGAVVGGLAAAALTAGLARAYGNNEGGRFCGACFAQWGAIAIPAGAGIGAGIGFAVRALGSDQQPGPWPPPSIRDRNGPGLRDRRHGVALSVTF
jgi:hypothetical protein